jgi:hypothetical protein
MPLKDDNTKILDQYFDVTITSKERACFETGIKLGAIFHSILGLPVRNQEETIRLLEDGINASFKSQPYVTHLQVRINVDSGKKYTKRTEFDYTIVKDYMIEVDVELVYKESRVSAGIRWVPELEYPLMFVKKIT